MAPRINGREIAALISDEDATDWMEEKKQNAAGTSQSTKCTMCASNELHPMRYKLLSCRSEPCSRAFPGVKCGWKGKVTICSKTKQANIYEAGEHFSLELDSPNRALKERHKQYCRLMAGEGLKPLRIRNGLRNKFSLTCAEMPTLSTVQSFVNNFARTRLAKHDRIHDINAMVKARVDPVLQSDDNAPITFTWPVDSQGNSFVGNGTDSSPFFAGVTTKALLRKLDRPSSSYVLHVDATYKLSQVGYPVLVIGISDCSRTFHLVAFCIVSQTTEVVYTAALASLNRLHYSVTGQRIILSYVMGDADDAQFNALQTVFGSSSKFKFLMCFFHVLLNVNKKLQAFPEKVAASIRHDIYDMHFHQALMNFYNAFDKI